MADDEGYGWMWPVFKIGAVLAGIGMIWYFLNRLFGGGDGAARDAQVIIADVWAEYDTEFKLFWEKGYLTPEEADILKAKLNLLEAPIKKFADSIPNVNEIAIKLGSLIIGLIFLYEVGKHAGVIGAQLRKFWDNIKGVQEGSIGQPVSGFDVSWNYATKEELGQLFRLSAIMDIADAGNIALASNMLAVENTLYFSSMLPQFQASYFTLQAQLPLLSGMQLAMAQYMMATYQVYLTVYVATLPPMFLLPPPI